MDSGGMPPDWKPSIPPAIGTVAWRRDVIEKSIRDRYSKYSNRAWNCGDLGTFVSIYSGNGWSGYWIENKNFNIVPTVDWDALEKQLL